MTDIKLDLIATPAPIVEHSPEWYEQRRRGIGGSDAAAVLGYSKWATPLDVWAKKTGLEESDSDSPVMLRGRIREPQIIQEYANVTGKTIYKAENLKHPKYPFIHANFDGLIPGDRIIEAKTAQAFSRDWGEPGSEDVPTEYYLQCQHYLLVATALKLIPEENPICDIFVSIGGEPIQIYTIKGFPELWAVMIAKYKTFWDLVKRRIPPEPVNAVDELKTLGDSKPETKYASAEIVASVTELKRLNTSVDRMTEKAAELRAALAIYAGRCDTVLKKDGSTLYTCKSQKPRVTIDAERLKAEMPEVYEQYTKTGKGTRPVKIK